MKKKIIQFLFVLCPIITFAQNAIYVEFNAGGMLHRGIIALDQSGNGIFRLTCQMNGWQIVVDQNARLSQTPNQFQQSQNWNPWSPQSGFGNGWQTSPQQHPSQAFIITCTNPSDARTGQTALNYTPDNFIYRNNQFIVQSGNQAVAVNALPIQSQQELQMLSQQLGLNGGQSATPFTSPQTGQPASTSPPSGPIPPSQLPKVGPKYPVNPGEGLGGL